MIAIRDRNRVLEDTDLLLEKMFPDPRCDMREYQGGMQPRAHSVLITPNTGCDRILIRDKILE